MTNKKIELFNKLKPRNKKQKDFIQAINEFDFLFCDSVYGVGKTFLTCGIISEWLHHEKIDRACICRTTTHLIKQYGYSSGNYNEKSLEYFRQQVEYFYHFLGKSQFETLWKQNKIELSAVELTRGRTLSGLVILEECQNSSKEDLLLFMSRIGKGSKVILIGDSSQSVNKNCFWQSVMSNIQHKNVAKVYFEPCDILRHGDIYEISEQIRKI